MTMKEKSYNSICESFQRRPHLVTDRNLAQIRRSSRTGADLLADVVDEQRRRGLLKSPRQDQSGHSPEKLARISDYPENKISVDFAKYEYDFPN